MEENHIYWTLSCFLTSPFSRCELGRCFHGQNRAVVTIFGVYSPGQPRLSIYFCCAIGLGLGILVLPTLLFPSIDRSSARAENPASVWPGGSRGSSRVSHWLASRETAQLLPPLLLHHHFRLVQLRACEPRLLNMNQSGVCAGFFYDLPPASESTTLSPTFARAHFAPYLVTCIGSFERIECHHLVDLLVAGTSSRFVPPSLAALEIKNHP